MIVGGFTPKRMTDGKRSIRQISGNLQKFQAVISELDGRPHEFCSYHAPLEVKVRVWINTDKRAAGQEIEDGIMLSPRQLEAAFHGEKETQTSPEGRPEAAGS